MPTHAGNAPAHFNKNHREVMAGLARPHLDEPKRVRGPYVTRCDPMTHIAGEPLEIQRPVMPPRRQV